MRKEKHWTELEHYKDGTSRMMCNKCNIIEQ